MCQSADDADELGAASSAGATTTSGGDAGATELPTLSADEVEAELAVATEAPAEPEEATTVGVPATHDDELESMTVANLRTLAKERGLTNVSRATKATLVERLRG